MYTSADTMDRKVDGEEEDEDYDEYEGLQDSLFFLHDIAEKGDIHKLKAVLPPKPTERPDPDDDMSIDQRRVETARMTAESCMLEKDETGCIPIHVAILHAQIDCAAYLWQYSEALTTAMLRLKCADLGTPLLHLVLRMGAVQPAFAVSLLDQMLSDAKAQNFTEDFWTHLLDKVRQRDEEGNSVFHLCAMYGLDMSCFLNLMKEEEANITDQGETMSAIWEKGNRVGMRPLHLAMKFHQLDTAKALLERLHASTITVTSLKETAGHIAAQSGFLDGLKLLVDKNGFDASAVEYRGLTALDIARRCGHQSIVQYLDSTADTKDTSFQSRIYCHDDCFQHLPLASYKRGREEPPPENLERVASLVNPIYGILRSNEFQRQHVSWHSDSPMADIIDILRVHEYEYVDKLQSACKSLAVENKTYALDYDTALSAQSFESAKRAAGTVCRAVDDVLSGQTTTSFCIVRPPGHHAGPVGKVTCENDPEGSCGFCLLNNVAIGAAYARSQYRRGSQSIEKVAILDFDVHHGNGTQEIIRQLLPSECEVSYATPYGRGKQFVKQYKPWRNEHDADNVFFTSVHGYGHKPQSEQPYGQPPVWFYPGSGASSCDSPPLIWNVGFPICEEGSAVSRLKWRSAFRDQVLPKLVDFNPDLIFLSAGFDAHKKELVNLGYVSLMEQDYEWLVGHVRRVANTCCQGRLISVLEGGYNFHGRIVSPFARSVAAHARALIAPTTEEWDMELVKQEAEHDAQLMNKLRQQHAKQESGEKRPSDTATSVLNVRSKRARKPVDYVALAEEIDREKKA